MAEPQDMIVPLLREIQAEIAEFRGETKSSFEVMDRRLEQKVRELESHK